MPYSRTHHIHDSMLTRNRKDTVAWRCTSKTEDINAGTGIDSDRTCSTLSSTGTTKITAQGEGSGLSARKGERSSPTRLLMDPGDYCSLQFLSDPSQSWFRAPQQGRLTAAHPAQRRGGCQAVLVSGKAGALASWACGSWGCHRQAE